MSFSGWGLGQPITTSQSQLHPRRILFLSKVYFLFSSFLQGTNRQASKLAFWGRVTLSFLQGHSRMQHSFWIELFAYLFNKIQDFSVLNVCLCIKSCIWILWWQSPWKRSCCVPQQHVVIWLYCYIFHCFRALQSAEMYMGTAGPPPPEFCSSSYTLRQ